MTGEVARWGVCLVAACALHVAGAAAIWVNLNSTVASAAAPVTVLVDLEPPPRPVVAAPTPPPKPPEPEVRKVEEPPPKPPEPEVRKVEEPPPPPVKPAVVLHKPPPKPVARPVEKVEEVPPPPKPVQVAPQKVETPTAPATQVAAVSPDLMSAWDREVVARIQRFMRYPRRAQLRGQEGVAYLRLTVARDGTVLAYALQRGTGIDALDDETLALVERAKPMPPMPAGTGKDRDEVVVPVRYFLR